MPRWTAERNAEYARRYNSGESFESILRSCPLERHALRMALRREGCVVRTKGESKFLGSLSEWHRRFGMKISEKLAERGLDKLQVAVKLGLSPKHVSAICRGEYDLKVRDVFVLCDWFGFSIEDVFRSEENAE